MKGGDKHKIQAMMLFNDMDRKDIELLRKKKNKTKVIENYLKIIDSCSVKYIDETKAILR